MNIFFLHEDGFVAGTMLHDLHLGKMQLELAQMLCTAVRLLKPEMEVPYKSTHAMHPMSVWLRQSADNVAWAKKHAAGMNCEWQIRRKRLHASSPVAFDAIRLLLSSGIVFPEAGLTSIPLCMPELYWQSGSKWLAWSKQ